MNVSLELGECINTVLIEDQDGFIEKSKFTFIRIMQGEKKVIGQTEIQ